jgi:hypothetical protein
MSFTSAAHEHVSSMRHACATLCEVTAILLEREKRLLQGSAYRTLYISKITRSENNANGTEKQLS